MRDTRSYEQIAAESDARIKVREQQEAARKAARRGFLSRQAATAWTSIVSFFKGADKGQEVSDGRPKRHFTNRETRRWNMKYFAAASRRANRGA